MIKITIGLKSGECITADADTLSQYEDILKLWKDSKEGSSEKFQDIMCETNDGTSITIYLPDIVFMKRDNADEV